MASSWTALIEAFAAGAGRLHDAIRGLTPQQILAPPPAGAPGTWSIQTIVVHTLDSDLIAAHRMKRIIAEERPPLLIGYDETAFARGLFYEKLDAGMAADLFRLNRLLTAQILRQVPAEGFERWGVHNENGKQTLGEILQRYTDHVEHHMRFVADKRRLMGKPMG